MRVGDDHAAALGEFMKARGVLINASPVVRLVMHLDVSREQLADVVKHWQAFYSVKEHHVPQRILVLGASGYIGQHLTTALSQQGHQVQRHAIPSACKSLVCRRDLSQRRSQLAEGTFRAAGRGRHAYYRSTAWAKAGISLPTSGRWR